ncbi:MAG TPA: AzlD domain-containing protein [Actinoplanes sp.]|nr:AzlD domain-containing protein [Actinoplanes sp.]
MNAWLVVLAAGLGSYLFRISVVTLADRFTMPDSLERATELIAPASFAAIAATGVANSCVGVAPAETLPPLAAVGVAVVAVARTGSPYAAMLAGMPVLWLASALVHWGG